MLITDDGETLLALPVEGLRRATACRICDALCAGRAAAGHHGASCACARSRRDDAGGVAARALVIDADKILALVADAKIDRAVDMHSRAGPAAMAAIQLVKLSQGLPAVLVAEVAAARRASLFEPPIDHRRG